MLLNRQQKQQLSIQAQKLKPVVLLGMNGLTENVLAEIDHALTAHELIKIKLGSTDHETKHHLSTEICRRMQAELILSIGHVISIYRKNKTDKSVRQGR